RRSRGPPDEGLRHSHRPRRDRLPPARRLRGSGSGGLPRFGRQPDQQAQSGREARLPGLLRAAQCGGRGRGHQGLVMADVRKDGNFYVTIRRIYTEQKPGEKGRALLYPVGRRLKEEEVKSLNLV